MWHPIISGALIGLLQLPTFIFVAEYLVRAATGACAVPGSVILPCCSLAAVGTWHPGPSAVPGEHSAPAQASKRVRVRHGMARCTALLWRVRRTGGVQGTSSAFVTIAALVARLWDRRLERSSSAYLRSHASGRAAFWQVALVFGTALGAYVSTAVSDVEYHDTFSDGAPLAVGCPSARAVCRQSGGGAKGAAAQRNVRSSAAAVVARIDGVRTLGVVAWK